MMSENNKEAEQDFIHLRRAVTAYDDQSDVVATLRGKLQHWLLWMMEMLMDSQILKKRKRLKLPEDSGFPGHKAFYRDRIIVDVSTANLIDEEWYVVVSPYPGIKSPITKMYTIQEGTRIFRGKRKAKTFTMDI